MSDSRTVLVVDDEDQLLRLMGRLVEKGGARALMAATANEARALFEAHASSIDLVLLDVTMPDGDGAEQLMPEFLGARPNLGVIVTSGDALPPALGDALERVGGRFLRKPFSPTALTSLLDAPSAGDSNAAAAGGSESS